MIDPGPPRFTVVIPAHNAEATVASAVASVLAQTEPRLELIVVDDGSVDSTAEVLDTIADHRLRVLPQPNQGVAHARNTGIAAARGELIAFLDADDLLMPAYLARMGAALAADPGAQFAFCDAWMFEHGSGRLRRRSVIEPYRPPGPLPRDPIAFFLAHLRANFVYVAVTIRRGIFGLVRGFNDELAAVADYEMWLRIEAAGHRAVEVPERLALYRSSPGQMSKNNAAMARELLRVFDLVEDLPNLPFEARQILVSRRREVEAIGQAAERPTSLIGRRRRLRRTLGRAWRSLPGQGLMLERPPPEVLAAFPDLGRS